MTTGDSVNGRGVEVNDRRYATKEKFSWLAISYEKRPDRSLYEVTRQLASASEMSCEGADRLSAPQTDLQIGTSKSLGA